MTEENEDYSEKLSVTEAELAKVRAQASALLDSMQKQRLDIDK